MDNDAPRNVLALAKEKLRLYRSTHSGEYVGGVEFTALMRMIDDAIAASKPEPRCVICGSDEPFSGTCGSPDARALCNKVSKPEPQAQAGEPDTIHRIDAMQNPMRPGYFMNYSKDETPAEIALRKLACWLGAGGYNAPTVDADMFHRKIVWAIEHHTEMQRIGCDAAIAKKDAALQACVEALQNYRKPMHLRTVQEEDAAGEALIQAQKALK